MIQIGDWSENFTSDIHSHVLADGAPVWVHAASASCVCVLCLPRVCLMQACRPCHVSHTEPNAINVSAHGGALWRRGHWRPGGPEPEWPPEHSAGQHQQHVSRLKDGSPHIRTKFVFIHVQTGFWGNFFQVVYSMKTFYCWFLIDKCAGCCTKLYKTKSWWLC